MVLTTNWTARKMATGFTELVFTSFKIKNMFSFKDRTPQ